MKTLKWGALALLVGGLIYFLMTKKSETPLARTESTLPAPGHRTPVSPAQVESKPVQNPRAPSALPPAADMVYEFLHKAAPEAHWTIRKNQSQKITSISGGLIHLPVEGLKTRNDWVEKLAEWAGLPPEQISRTENSLPETDFSRTLQFQQSYQGYRVDQSFIRITERKTDNAILHSQIELRDIGEPDLKINISRDEAQALGLERFAQKKGAEIITVAPQPVIFSAKPGQGELAWKLAMKIQGSKYDERRVMISAKSGKVLQDISSLQY